VYVFTFACFLTTFFLFPHVPFSMPLPFPFVLFATDYSVTHMCMPSTETQLWARARFEVWG
jgi:hypothetical protein